MNYKYPIDRIFLSPYGELRYWKDKNEEYHIAFWLDDECIIKDDDKPLSDVLRSLVKEIIKGKMDSDIANKMFDISQGCVGAAESSIKYYEDRLKKVCRQRNYYSKLLKERNKEIKKLRAEKMRQRVSWWDTI